MQCDYFDARACRSCTLLHTSYDDQLAAKQMRCESTIPAVRWLPPRPSRPEGFRNKAKLVVGGRPGQVTLGILDADQHGVDLRDCGLYEPGLAEAIPILGELVNELRLLPYDVARRRGELKHLILTHSPDGELMVRFVLRSEQQSDRITADRVQGALPRSRVVSINLQPAHKAVIDGTEERLLSTHPTLPMRLDRTLHLRPRSFFQTNTAVAQDLYRQAARWADASDPTSILDAYCGVGGFALHLAQDGRHVVGVDVEPGRSDQVEFVRADALEYAVAAYATRPAPDLLVVNPPRRGIGAMASWIESSRIERVIYSSCNPDSLAKDLAIMGSYDVVEGRAFDMFPQTDHLEVLVLLERVR